MYTTWAFYSQHVLSCAWNVDCFTLNHHLGTYRATVSDFIWLMQPDKIPVAQYH